ncbi:MAG: hypothetical protein ACQET7_07100 [Thermodesulfobacteriota bacterium]
METAMKTAVTERHNALQDIDWTLRDWQRELRHNITAVDELKTYLPLTEEQEYDLRQVAGIHPMNIPGTISAWLMSATPRIPYDDSVFLMPLNSSWPAPWARQPGTLTETTSTTRETASCTNAAIPPRWLHPNIAPCIAATVFANALWGCRTT